MKNNDVLCVIDHLECSTAALRRVGQFVHIDSWARWAILRVTPTQQRILRVLSEEAAGLSLSSISRELSVSPATISDSVKSMQRKGLVLKQGNEGDARKRTLSLTKQGRKYLEKLAALPDALLAVVATLSESEQEHLHSLLEKVVSRLEECGHLPVARGHASNNNGTYHEQRTEGDISPSMS